MNQRARSESTISSLDATLDAFQCPRSRIPARSTRTHIIKHATPLASTTESGEKSTEARAQRSAEVSGDPASTATTHASTEHEPLADRQKQHMDERCASHRPNELRTRRNAPKQVRHVRIVLGMQQGSPGYDALNKLSCANRKVMLTSSNAACERALGQAGQAAAQTLRMKLSRSRTRSRSSPRAGPGSSSTASESSDHQLALRAGSCTICAPHCAVSAGRTGERGGEC